MNGSDQPEIIIMVTFQILDDLSRQRTELESELDRLMREVSEQRALLLPQHQNLSVIIHRPPFLLLFSLLLYLLLLFFHLLLFLPLLLLLSRGSLCFQERVGELRKTLQDMNFKQNMMEKKMNDMTASAEKFDQKRLTTEESIGTSLALACPSHDL